MRKNMVSVVLLGLLAGVGCVGMQEQAGSSSGEVKGGGPMLNLSHIECLDSGGVDAHFVLLFAGSGTPGTLTGTWTDGVASYTFSAQPERSTGNVWHYDITLPSGEIDITSAQVTTSTGVVVSLHNPDAYSGDYQCGGIVETCQVAPPTEGLLCTDHPLTNPGAECGYFGLVPSGKDDNLSGLTWVATQDAYVAVVKSGTHGCGPGNSAYNIYVNVTAGEVLSTPVDQAISHVTYCECPLP